jgi:hypothetical protein
LSAKIDEPPAGADFLSDPGGSDVFPSPETATLSLADLPTGARLILRCRKDWRDATVAAVTVEAITLSVCSPSGHTYRVRRPPDSLLLLEGSIPLLGEGSWRVGFARYERRW